MSMIALFALAAGTVALPQPNGKPERWLRPEDIPQSEFEAGKDGSFIYRALVGPDGKVDRCDVIASDAAKSEWSGFCDHVKRSFGFQSVTDHEAAPAYYLLEEVTAYVLPQTWVRNSVPMPADMVVEVDRLAGAKDGKLDLPVNVAIGADGALRECNADGTAQAMLGTIACNQLRANWSPIPEKNAAGKPVAYVRRLTVEFQAKTPVG